VSVKNNIDDQHFSRLVLQDWLTANGLPTKYQFARPETKQPLKQVATGDQLSTKEENTFLAIIAVLCGAANIDAAKREAIKVILNQADLMGIKLSESTLKSKLAKIPRALESRGK
jgi:hypothetical protein